MDLDYWRHCTKFLRALYAKKLITVDEHEAIWRKLVSESMSDYELEGVAETKALAEKYPEVFAVLRVKQKLLGEE